MKNLMHLTDDFIEHLHGFSGYRKTNKTASLYRFIICRLRYMANKQPIWLERKPEYGMVLDCSYYCGHFTYF